MRPRPLRFDELRTGNKSRKSKKTTAVKNEHHVASIASRVSASSDCSSWESDDSGTCTFVPRYSVRDLTVLLRVISIQRVWFFRSFVELVASLFLSSLGSLFSLALAPPKRHRYSPTQR
jgi:hypothetical protein